MAFLNNFKCLRSMSGDPALALIHNINHIDRECAGLSKHFNMLLIDTFCT